VRENKHVTSQSDWPVKLSHISQIS